MLAPLRSRVVIVYNKNMSSRSPFYINGNSIIFSTAIYTDSALTTPATDGFYSDGTNSVKQEGGEIVESYVCTDCICSTQTVDSTGPSAVYNSSIVTGEGTGAIMIKITMDINSAPVGFRAYESFTGTQTYHNRIINKATGFTPNGGYVFTYPATAGRFVQIGNNAALGECCSALSPSGTDCFKLTGSNTEFATNKLIDSLTTFPGVAVGDVVVNGTTGQSATVTSIALAASNALELSANIFLPPVPSGNFEVYQIFNNYDVYNWDGDCFNDSAVTDGQPVYASDAFIIDYTGKTTPEEWYMVVPKTTATKSTLVLQAFASCISNNWSVEVGCPAPLTSFPISDAGDSVCREVGNTAYSAPVTGTAGSPGLWDFVFSDINGLTPYPDGTYVIIHASTGKYITITNGVITFHGASCTE
jgi:hypothetical protein